MKESADKPNKTMGANLPATTRFAPSPTGYIHIGNVRSAVYPYLVARQTGGTFILRIEDTDQLRLVEGATELIIETLEWLGLEWDEGPIVGGPDQPYFQSQRKEIYKQWGQKLIDSGRAYADPTSKEQIEKYRKEAEAKKEPFLYRNYRPANPPEWKEGIPLRFKSEPKAYQWHDEVMGDLETGPEVLDDIILIKADGLPTYNFAHIVDDAEMKCTHVIRGVEYVSSTPNYLALYEAFNLPRPKLVSLPHILAPTGGKKLSKRDGAKSVTDYRNAGILPEAMLNYLACLGWNDGTEKEIYSKAELLESFSIDRINNSGARFDETKLIWMNGQWIRKIHDEQGLDALYARTEGFWPEQSSTQSILFIKKVLAITYDRLKTLADLPMVTSYFFETPAIDLSAFAECKFLKGFSQADLADLLEQTIHALESVSDWNQEKLQTVLNNLLASTELKPAQLFSLIRIAISYAPFSPALHLTLDVLGKETSISRLKDSMQALRGAL